MKQIMLATTFCCTALSAGVASANELWDEHIRGLDVGLIAGALPPQGVYFVNNLMFATFNNFDASSNKITNTRLNGMVDVPILLWSTGWKVLGGAYAVGISQPFDYTSIGSGYGPLFPTGPGKAGFYNTIVAPGQLSWALGDVHLKAGLQIYLDDATSTVGSVVNGKSLNGSLPSGNGFTTVDPTLAVSWLKNGWNLSVSANLQLPVSRDSAVYLNTYKYTYSSGKMLLLDYTAAKTIGKWTVGLGGSSQNQLTNDTGSFLGQPNPSKESVNYSVGPLVGYTFGAVSLMATWMHGVYTRNDVGGELINLRLITRF